MYLRLVLALYCLNCYAVLFGHALAIDTSQVYTLDIVSIDKPIRTIDDDNNTIDVDSTAYLGQTTGQVSDVLRENSSLFFLSTGVNGTIATVRQRGFSSDHSLVTWNGIPINNITEGGLDFSNLPSFQSQTIEITQGGTGTFYGSGNFSGVIDFSSKPSWKKNAHLSYGRSYDYLLDASNNELNVRAGNKKIQFSASGKLHSSTNEYSFYDKILKDSSTITHNGFTQQALISDLFYRPRKHHTFHIAYWGQSKTKEIPALQGQSLPSNKEQHDSFNKYLASYKYTKSKLALQIQSSFQNNYLLYTDKFLPSDSVFSVYSELDAKRAYSEISAFHKTHKLFTTKGGIIHSLKVADVDNYQDRITENDFAAYAATEIGNKKHHLSISGRQDFYQITDAPFIYSFSGVSSLLKDFIQLRAAYSKKFKSPDFNDRHWTPGGNPDLNPETGYGYEFGIRGYTKGKIKAQYFITYFYTEINDKIVWIPLGSHWGPVNYNLVKSSGLESHLKLEVRVKKIDFGITINYTSVSATNHNTQDANTEGKMLIYTPKEVFSSNLYIKNRYAFFKFTSTYTSQMYTTEDNLDNRKVEPYLLHHLSIGTYIPMEDRFVSLSYRIDNLFDTPYELKRFYPMPGRHHSISINVGLNKQ